MTRAFRTARRRLEQVVRENANLRAELAAFRSGRDRDVRQAQWEALQAKAARDRAVQMADQLHLRLRRYRALEAIWEIDIAKKNEEIRCLAALRKGNAA